MRRYILIISLIVLTALPRPGRADTIDLCQPQYDISGSAHLYAAAENINPDITLQNSEPENPLRRFEVTFFISLPFVFIANFIALHTYEVIRQGDFNVSVWEEHSILLPAATLAVSTGVAFRAAYTGSGSAQRVGAEFPGERTISLSAACNY